jgi:predicted ATPase/DNA-binding SARP family transcriptional activator
MDFRILGPLEVLDEGAALSIGGRRQRALLAVLLLHVNQVVSADRLIEALWGERVPDSGRAALHVRVSQLRKALGPGGAQLVTRPPGYVLQIDLQHLDSHRFERLLAESDGAPAELAAVRLREALALWRGPALADLAYESFVQTAIRRLEELRLVAIERRIEAELALGRHSDLVGELETLLAEHPLHERLHGQLMLALYRAGRQADALSAYRRFSERLRDQLGLDPGSALRELERSILAHDPALASPRQPAGSNTHVPRSEDDAAAGRLPMNRTPFVGRARELAELAELLRVGHPRLLTVTGAGGSGKTRLALALAGEIGGQYRDGARFAGLADLADPALIADTICHALGLEHAATVPADQHLAAFLADRELLLILDNLEHLLPVTDQITGLLAAGPDVTLLVTSREPLGVEGEQQYEVPVLDPEDAVELFRLRARTSSPRVRIDRRLAGEICERLDRLPLAIELAAARVKALDPAELRGRLNAALPLLTGGPRDAPQRQRTLRATIDWSYRLLDDVQQTVFARLAVFGGGCTLAAAEAVCQADLDTLTALVDRSLVRLVGGRYRMLETLREYAAERLVERGESDQLHRALTEWLLGVLADVTPPDHVYPQVSRLLPERENFRAAVQWAQQTGDTATLAVLVSTRAYPLWIPRVSEARSLAESVLATGDELEPSMRVDVLKELRYMVWRSGEIEEALVLNKQILSLYRELRDTTGECIELMMSGVLETERGDFTSARDGFERAIRLGREYGVVSVIPNALANLADLEIEQGDLDAAVTLCQEAITLAQEFGLPTNDVGYIGGHINMAHVANLQARHRDAVSFARMAVEGALARADQSVAAVAFELAWPLAELRHPERAARLLGAALAYTDYTGAIIERTDKVCEQAARNAITEQLGGMAFQELLDLGREIGLEQAIGYEMKLASEAQPSTY